MSFHPFNQRLFQQYRPISDIAPFVSHAMRKTISQAYDFTPRGCALHA